MTTMIECSVFYHIMKELKLTIEYLGRYKTKTDSTTFCNILPKYSLLSSSSSTTTVAHIHFFPSCQFQTYNTCSVGQKGHIHPKQKNSISLFGNALQGQKMTTMIECSVFYHIMKELKLTIEYLGRYKTKTYSTTFCNIFKYFHC